MMLLLVLLLYLWPDLALWLRASRLTEPELEPAVVSQSDFHPRRRS